jgi:hypothetical protein
MSMYDGLDLNEEQLHRLRDLTGLPATAVLEKRLAQQQADLAAQAGWEMLPETGQRRSGLLDQIARTEQPLAAARERDAIQATRPSGCWCLGVGGQHPSSDRVGNQVWRFLADHCQCP